MSHDTRMAERRNELISDLVAVVERVLGDCEIPPSVATVTASALADRLADHWGGQNISFPKDFRWKLAKLELSIYDEWSRGAQFGDLALKHRMTERGVRKLITRVRSRVAAAAQPGLFEPQGEH